MKGWQITWFYCKDVSVAGGQSGLPPYSTERVWSPPSLTAKEKTDMDIMVMAVVAIVGKGLNGMDLLEVFL